MYIFLKTKPDVSIWSNVIDNVINETIGKPHEISYIEYDGEEYPHCIDFGLPLFEDEGIPVAIEISKRTNTSFIAEVINEVDEVEELFIKVTPDGTIIYGNYEFGKFIPWNPQKRIPWMS